MITKASKITPRTRKVRALIAGYPGMGKSTLACSAPSPLVIDCDKGLYRADASVVNTDVAGVDANGAISYETILADLTPETTADYETLVFDTGGKLISLISAWAIRKDPKYGQRDGSLSLKGYGVVGREFQRLMDYCYYTLNKNIVMVFHATEDKDGDNVRLRIKVEGQTKNNVWENMDLGGFMEMQGDDRTIGFSNCERYFAKGTRGVHGVWKVPDLSTGCKNDFLTRLFQKFNEAAVEEAVGAEMETAAFEETMEKIRKIIDAVQDYDGLIAAQEKLREVPEIKTSKKQGAAMLMEKAKKLGYKYSVRTGFVKKEG